jgi:hypothetical protein
VVELRHFEHAKAYGTVERCSFINPAYVVRVDLSEGRGVLVSGAERVDGYVLLEAVVVMSDGHRYETTKLLASPLGFPPK